MNIIQIKYTSIYKNRPIKITVDANPKFTINKDVKLPKRIPHIRSYNTKVIDYINNVEKKIIYPLDFWFNIIDDNDTLEQELEEINNNIPNWYNINILLLDDHEF